MAVVEISSTITLMVVVVITASEGTVKVASTRVLCATPFIDISSLDSKMKLLFQSIQAPLAAQEIKNKEEIRISQNEEKRIGSIHYKVTISLSNKQTTYPTRLYSEPHVVIL